MSTFAARHTHVRKAGTAVVLKPAGDLMGGEETDELEKLIAEADEDQVPCLVINLGGVSMMNSLSISRLIRGHVRFSQRKARMSLCSLDARIQNIFVITKLSMVFNVYSDEAAALDACGGS